MTGHMNTHERKSVRRHVIQPEAEGNKPREYRDKGKEPRLTARHRRYVSRAQFTIPFFHRAGEVLWFPRVEPRSAKASRNVPLAQPPKVKIASHGDK